MIPTTTHRYTCDGGSIRLESNGFAVLFSNDFGDGDHPVTVGEYGIVDKGDARFITVFDVFPGQVANICHHDCTPGDHITELPAGKYHVFVEGAHFYLLRADFDAYDLSKFEQ